MDRIPEERKGVVWCYWTSGERECFVEAAKRGLTIQYFSCDQKWIDATDLDFACTGVPAGLWRSTAFWIKEWDEPTGKELVGYLCWVTDFLDVYEQHCNKQAILTVVQSYDSNEPMPYSNGVIRYRYAWAAKPSEVNFHPSVRKGE